MIGLNLPLFQADTWRAQSVKRRRLPPSLPAESSGGRRIAKADAAPEAELSWWTRRSVTVVGPVVLFGCLASFAEPDFAVATTPKLSPQFVAAFNKALSLSGDSAKAIKAWTDVIALDPTNSSAWSNRGTVHLQQGEWQAAREDLKKALELESEGGDVSGILLNNLGNAEGALGDWESAMQNFRNAALDADMTPIALANLALAFFQLGRSDEAIAEARSLVRKDPNFLDMRAALTGFLWSVGEEAAAESEWTRLQGANDGLGGLIYTRAVAIKRVQGRWPPRAVAALDAFLKVSRRGESLDYDRTRKTFDFAT